MAEQDIQDAATEQAPSQKQAPQNSHRDHDDDDGKDLSEQLAEAKRELARLNRSFGTTVADRKRMSEALKRWNKLGVEPDDVEDLLAKKQESEEKRARETGEIDTLLKNQAAKFAAQLAEKEALLAEKHRLIEALTVDAELTKELEKIKVRPSLMEGAFAIHRNKTKIVDDPEAPHGLRVVAEVAGDNMPLNDWLKQWSENDPNAGDYLLGNQASGGGAPPGRNVGGAVRVYKGRLDMTPAEKSKFIRQWGKSAYDALPRHTK